MDKQRLKTLNLEANSIIYSLEEADKVDEARLAKLGSILTEMYRLVLREQWGYLARLRVKHLFEPVQPVDATHP